MPESLTPQELQVILKAAQKLKLDPNNLSAANPFDAEYAKTATGQAIRMAISESDPAMAAQLTQKSGHKQSLAVAAFNAGITEKTHAIHQELMESDPTYVKLHTENTRLQEEKLLMKMETEARQMAERRGVDLDSKIGIGNYDPKFAAYFRNLQQDQLLDEKVKREGV